jgi:long-chain acyl-CoA synthetase
VNLASVVDPHPDEAPAVVDPTGQTMTYGELRTEVARLRGGLSPLGVAPADRVALVMGNDIHFVAAYLAVLGVGAVAVPLNPLSPAAELQRELAVVTPRAMVVGSPGASTVARLDRAELPTLDHVVAAPGVELEGSRPWEELLTADPTPVAGRQPDELAVLMFTSGTAGSPRAAMLSHGNLLANLEQIAARPPCQGADDVALGALPVFHIYGLQVVLGVSLAAGSRVVLVERFDPHTSLELIRRYGITVVAGVPTMWSAWASQPGVSDDALASLRLATSGAAPLDVAVRQALRERFGVSLSEGYGLTEASPAVTSGLGRDVPDGSIGAPLRGVEVRLVDANGNDVLVGDPGEVWVRGPNVFRGYWEDPDATAVALTADGWLRTGDVGLVDDDGALFLVDRAKDLVIVSGFNVFPAEVEAVLDAHPGVIEAAVVGRPDPVLGEAVVAFVVPSRPDGELDQEEVIAFCAQRLARYKCPQQVIVVDELPHGPAGKLLRRALH